MIGGGSGAEYAAFTGSTELMGSNVGGGGVVRGQWTGRLTIILYLAAIGLAAKGLDGGWTP